MFAQGTLCGIGRTWTSALAIAFLFVGSSASPRSAAAGDGPTSADHAAQWFAARLPADAPLAVSPQQATRALPRPEANKDWKPRVNDDVTRGPAAEIYPKIAPAIVVVRAGDGHGTGFVVDPAGWILTNQHVVQGGGIDPATGALTLTIHRGSIKTDGLMELDEQPLPATVYKASEDKDLALIKLDRPLSGDDALLAIKLAEQPAKPGASCISIGHPRAGLLWTVRSGEVSGVGVWPGEMIEAVMTRLSMTGSSKDQLTQLLKAAPQRKVLVSNCGSNPGDSGGPLVNEQGELIAVTFAIPQGGAEEGISLDKFSYHVHLDEVRAFLADRPEHPELFVPDAWPTALFSVLMDSDGDQRADAWMFGIAPEAPPTGLLYDLDQDTPAGFAEQCEKDLRTRETWDFEFAVQQYPLSRTFYDTDNDGHMDLILTDTNQDETADLVLVRQGDQWTQDSDVARPMVAATPFADPHLQERFVTVLRSKPVPLGSPPASVELASPSGAPSRHASGTRFSYVAILAVGGALIAVALVAGRCLRRPRQAAEVAVVRATLAEPDGRPRELHTEAQPSHGIGQSSGLQITVCAHCHRRIVVKQDGTCPSCGTQITL